MRWAAALAAGAGFVCVSVALAVLGVVPTPVSELIGEVSRAAWRAVGDVRWARAPIADDTPLARLGRRVYVREGCWYCHSQSGRPGRPLLSTPWIGPDISHIGPTYSDDWHYAHHWDPRLTVPDSIMPRSPWLFTELAVPVERGPAGPTLARTPASAPYFTFRADRPLTLFPDPSGLVFVPPRADGEWPLDGTPVLDLAPLHGRAVPLLVRLVIPTRELIGLVHYLQRRGAGPGVGRDPVEPPRVALAAGIPHSDDLRSRGEVVYRHRCVGCHGAHGDGNGPAATFLFPRPRDFTIAIFKFKTTPPGSLPRDADLYRTITRGVRWTAMPSGAGIPERDRRAVIAYIKTFSRRWTDETVEPAAVLGAPPPVTPGLLARGRDVYREVKCWECHGAEGRGDGPALAGLRDDFGAPSPPTDFTRGELKDGAEVADVFRTLTLGLDGTPMRSFADVLDEADRWALAYYVLSLSARSDPLSGERLALPAALSGPR